MIRSGYQTRLFGPRLDLSGSNPNLSGPNRIFGAAKVPGVIHSKPAKGGHGFVPHPEPGSSRPDSEYKTLPKTMLLRRLRIKDGFGGLEGKKV